MVKVISVHNFLKQDISSVDELIDLTPVPPDTILIVQSDHTILVKDLSLVNDKGYIIPTVDQVVKIVYSVQGNYIATLEKKQTRKGIDVFYIRIYSNWETLRKYEELPPLRARIAGRVTPLSQNHEGLEMIEIPTLTMPDNIVCCPISGNLLMSSKNTLSLYKLKIQTHDISKMYFIDFEQILVDFILSFIPSKMEIVENVVAVQSDEFLHVFKILSNQSCHSNGTKDKEHSNEDLGYIHEVAEDHKAINYDKLSKDIKFKYFNDANSLKSLKQNKNVIDGKESQCELRKINSLSFPVQHDFPTIAAWRSSESNFRDVHKQNPFLFGQDLVVNMISLSASEGYKNPYRIESILQYQLMPLMLGSSTNRQIQEKFTSLILKPFYSPGSESATGKPTSLESEHVGKLKTVACIFGTQQEGYLHCFEYDNPNKEDGLKSYVVYPFTAPVIQVKAEDSFLHALTETGLETYTMRAATHLIKNNDKTACPSFDDPVCLIGLRPFVNVFKMCITNHNLVLFASNQESTTSTWTLYKLNLPSPSSIWNDFLAVAEENKWEAPATYSHLIGEGHLVLKTYLNSIYYVSGIESPHNQVHSPVSFVNSKERNLVEKMYHESCALLGDFHILNKDFLKASNYYRMSNYKINEIVKRVEGLSAKIPERYQMNYDQSSPTKGLIYYLKKTLAAYDENYVAFTGNREEFYTLEIGNIINTLFDFLEKQRDVTVSDLILDSVVLREFSTDRMLKMMKNVLSTSSPPKEKDALSLALMCIQRDQIDQAKTVLQTMTPERIGCLVLQYHHLLFEKNIFRKTISFTELSMVLMETYPAVIGNILSYLICRKQALGLSTLLKIFLDILPSGYVKEIVLNGITSLAKLYKQIICHICVVILTAYSDEDSFYVSLFSSSINEAVQSKNSSVVLQIVLENYFRCYFEKFPLKKCDQKSIEALKILVRIYLTFLKQKVKWKDDLFTENDEDILFYKSRRDYLQHLPPFASEVNEFLSLKCGTSPGTAPDKELKSILLRIQCLLSYDNLPTECITEVRNYINNQGNVYGSLSLQILSAASVQEGLQLIINLAPQAVIQYIKDCVNDIDDWKFAVQQIHMKVNAADEDSTTNGFYRKILTDILLHGSKCLEIEDLAEILPRDFDDGENYLKLAQNNAQSKHIRTLIMTTGKQLQTTLYDSVPQKNGQFS